MRQNNKIKSTTYDPTRHCKSKLNLDLKNNILINFPSGLNVYFKYGNSTYKGIIKKIHEFKPCYVINFTNECEVNKSAVIPFADCWPSEHQNYKEIYTVNMLN